MAKPKNVTEYIASAPKEVRGMVKELRRLIKSAAPKAEEKINWSMPYFYHKGPVVGFYAFKKHVSLFVNPPVVTMHKKELKGFKTAKATVQFPIGKKLPAGLIKKLVKARVKLNEEKFKLKRKKK